MDKLRVLSLFAGIGGFDLGLEKTGGFETVAFCEFAEFPRKILAKHWPHVPCFPDVRTLKGSDVGPVDVICGGYPCQPFSTAGKRQGAEDDRHLWPEFSRLVDELRPTWVIGENVAGHISMGLDDVLADLEAKGYACRTFVIPACAVGAPHRRDRVWTVAHSERVRPHAGEASSGREGHARNKKRHSEKRTEQSGAGRDSQDVAHADDQGLQGRAQARNPSSVRQGRDKQSKRRSNGEGSAWRTVTGMGGVADGFSCWLDEPRERVKPGVKDRADRLKALGNAVHPDIPLMIGRAILAAEAAK